MLLSSILLVLTSAALHVGWNLTTKCSANSKIFLLMKGLASIAIAAILLCWLPLHAIPRDIWFYIFLSGIVHAVYFIALGTAYETGDISYVYPIARSAPAFVPIIAFFAFGERLTAKGYLGIIIVTACIVILQFRRDTSKEPKSIFAFLKKKDCFWAFVTLAAVVAYSCIDKSAMVLFKNTNAISHNMHALTFHLLEGSLAFTFLWIYMLINGDVKDKFPCKREWPKAIFAAIASILSYTLILHVMKSENLSLIVTLRQMSILFAVLVGWLALKEKLGPLRFIVSAIMLIGLLLVAISG